MKRKKFAGVYVSILLIVLVILTIDSRLDLDISISVFNVKSIVGIITEVLAELPIDISLLASASYIIVAGVRKKGVKKIIYLISGFLLSLVGGFYSGFIPVTFLRLYFEGSSSPLYFIAIPITIVIAILFMNWLYCKYGDRFLNMAFMYIVYFWVSFIVSYTVKIPFGRMRFRDMEYPLEQFTAWYIVNGVTGNDSFPSGHVINASFIFYIVYMARKILNLKNDRTKGDVLAGIWIITVACGRVIVGAHFLSDVTMGAIIGFMLSQIMRIITDRLPNIVPSIEKE